MAELGSQKDGGSREEPDSVGEGEEKRYNPIDESERTWRTAGKENKEYRGKGKLRDAPTWKKGIEYKSSWI